MREFGAEALTARDRSVARRRHRDYFLALAERAATQAGEREQVGWLAWVQRESADLRAALDYSFATPGEEACRARLTLALRCYWLMLGAFGEGMHWHELAMTADTGACDNAWAIYGAGILAAQQGDLDAAGPLLERAARIATGVEAPRRPDPALAGYVTDAQGIGGVLRRGQRGGPGALLHRAGQLREVGLP